MPTAASPGPVSGKRRRLLFAAAVWLAALLAAEATGQLLVVLRARPARYVADPAIGWVHSIQWPATTGHNACGEPIRRVAAPDPLLVRQPEDPRGRRLLFVGDSYTEASQVSTGQAYHDVVGELLGDDHAVFALGASGYNNAQEWLALESVITRVQPQIVGWQLTGNDVSGNVHQWDRRLWRTPGMAKAYFDAASGEFTVAAADSWLLRHSRLARFARNRGLRLDARYQLGVADAIERLRGLDAATMPRYRAEGLAALEALIARFRQIHPEIDLFGFTVDEEFDGEFADIFARHGVTYLAGFPARITTDGPTDCRPLDPHWNILGHRRAGEVLAGWLRQSSTQRIP